MKKMDQVARAVAEKYGKFDTQPKVSAHGMEAQKTYPDRTIFLSGFFVDLSPFECFTTLSYELKGQKKADNPL